MSSSSLVSFPRVTVFFLSPTCQKRYQKSVFLWTGPARVGAVPQRPPRPHALVALERYVELLEDRDLEAEGDSDGSLMIPLLFSDPELGALKSCWLRILALKCNPGVAHLWLVSF